MKSLSLHNACDFMLYRTIRIIDILRHMFINDVNFYIDIKIIILGLWRHDLSCSFMRSHMLLKFLNCKKDLKCYRKQIVPSQLIRRSIFFCVVKIISLHRKSRRCPLPVRVTLTHVHTFISLVTSKSKRLPKVLFLWTGL